MYKGGREGEGSLASYYFSQIIFYSGKGDTELLCKQEALIKNLNPVYLAGGNQVLRTVAFGPHGSAGSSLNTYSLVTLYIHL